MTLISGRQRKVTYGHREITNVGIAIANVRVRYFRFGTSHSFRRLFLLHIVYIEKQAVLGKGMCFTRSVGVSFGGLFSDAVS